MQVMQFTCRIYRRDENIGYVISLASLCVKDTKWKISKTEHPGPHLGPEEMKKGVEYVTKPGISWFRQVTNYC
jgi:hypothetical protein